MSGATQADLTISAQTTQLYVCRVSDQFCHCVFSDWVKVKVLDVDESGIQCPIKLESPMYLMYHILRFWYCCEFNDIFFLPKLKGLPGQWQGEPHIAVNPKPQAVRPGEKITLRCAAFGIPPPQYQWYRNGYPLPNKTSDTLQVRSVYLPQR